MTDLSLLQLVAYGVMGVFLFAAFWRAAVALDLARTLGAERRAARRLLAAVRETDPERRRDALRGAARALSRRPGSALAGLVAAADEGDGDAAFARFEDEVRLRTEPARHGLSQLMRVAAPLGLAFTTLVLAVSLTALDPGAGSGADGLLDALPLSLVTTVMAMFASIPMRLVEGLLRHAAADLLATVEALVAERLRGGDEPPEDPR